MNILRIEVYFSISALFYPSFFPFLPFVHYFYPCLCTLILSLFPSKSVSFGVQFYVCFLTLVLSMELQNMSLCFTLL